MSTTDEVKKLIEETNARTEALKRELEQVKLRIAEQRRAREKMVSAHQSTTLDEYLTCIEWWPHPLSLQVPDTCMRALTTSVEHKLRPETLRSDPLIRDRLEQVERDLERYLGPSQYIFASRDEMEQTEDRLEELMTGSKQDPNEFNKRTIDMPVQNIVRAFQRRVKKQNKDVTAEKRYGSDFTCSNHFICDIYVGPMGDQPFVDNCFTVTDTIGGNRVRRPVLIAKLKAPYKLTRDQLKAGLKDLDLDRFVNCSISPAEDDKQGSSEHRATLIVAEAMTQLYDHKIQSGVCLGVTVMGEDAIATRIDWEQPGILYYHQLEAVSLVKQLACLCILASERSELNLERTRTLIEELPRWNNDDMKMSEQTQSASPAVAQSCTMSSYDQIRDFLLHGSSLENIKSSLEQQRLGKQEKLELVYGGVHFVALSTTQAHDSSSDQERFYEQEPLTLLGPISILTDSPHQETLYLCYDTITKSTLPKRLIERLRSPKRAKRSSKRAKRSRLARRPSRLSHVVRLPEVDQ